MKAVAIISELNPFHNGHSALIKKVKEAFPERAVVCFCSAEYVQRGQIALLPLSVRSKAAVLCGADAVLSLPCAYTLAPAEIYAKSVISLISECGIADTLAFGSECGDIGKISEVSARLHGDELEKRLSEYVNLLPYPIAREKAYTELYGECDIFKSPNDMLGFEYVNALKEKNIAPFTVKRATGEGIKSASEIRNMLKNGVDIRDFVPKEAFETVKTAAENGEMRSERYSERMILSAVAFADGEYADVPADFLRRMKRCARESSCLAEYYEKLSVKQYTEARIRRMTMCTALKIKRKEWTELPPYVRLYGANEMGTRALKQSKIPVLVKPADADKIGGAEFLEREISRENIAFCSQKTAKSVADLYRFTPFIDKTYKQEIK